MQTFGKIIYIILIALVFSCSSKKNIIYLQDFEGITEKNYNFQDYKISVDDVLKIDLYSELFNNDLTTSLNPKSSTQAVINNIDILIANGFQVDSEGYIHYPEIGKLYVKGKSVNEIRDEIQNRLISDGLLLKPNVDVKHINAYFTILGEVNAPGKHRFLQNNLNIFEAIGMAGDLNINGQRKDIVIIRNNNGQIKTKTIDLTSSSIITSDFFQIFPKDIIIINPNYSQVKQAGIIGNAGNLLSLLSFILSSIIVMNR